MADSGAVRAARCRAKAAAKRVLHGARDFALKFESYRGTTADIVLICEARGLDHPEMVNEMLTQLIHEEAKKLKSLQ